MADPVLLVHGYGSEAGTSGSRRSVETIYGGLPRWLEDQGQIVAEVDLGRYVSLDDGIGLNDISRALDAAIADHDALRSGHFNAIVHSTGALVVRNWLRMFCPNSTRLRNLVHLAGANFGSGWAHIGQGQLVRWGREVFQGTEVGALVLDALELGSSDTIDLHLHHALSRKPIWKLGVREFQIIGTQSYTEWFLIPIRYPKEDGADGVVRVPASNLNFRYFRYEATDAAAALSSREVIALHETKRLSPRVDPLHRRTKRSVPGDHRRPVVPFAVPFATAHTGDERGVIDGDANREHVEPLLLAALEADDDTDMGALVEQFDEVTTTGRELVRGEEVGGLFGRKNWSAQTQYDGHSMVILRLTDQDGGPVEHYDVWFGRERTTGSPTDVGDLIQHTHVNGSTPNVICFMLRVEAWDGDAQGWVDRRDEVDSMVLEVTAEEPRTGEIQYVPFRLALDRDQLHDWLVPNATTIVDIVMRRSPSTDVFVIR